MTWQPIDTVPEDQIVDLFGWIVYDGITMRLPDCEFINGVWCYCCAGKMLPCGGLLSFTPTHWMYLPDDPI